MSDKDVFDSVAIDIMSKGNLDLIDEVFAADYIEHEQPPPGVPANREGVKMFMGAMRQAFPDLKLEIMQSMHDGDMYIGHVRATGTMKGDFMGMKANNKPAAWEEMHIARMRNGKLVEHWGVEDRLGMMQQLGFAESQPTRM